MSVSGVVLNQSVHSGTIKVASVSQRGRYGGELRVSRQAFGCYSTVGSLALTVETKRRVMGLKLLPLTKNISTKELLVKVSLNYSPPLAMSSRFPVPVGHG